MGDDAARGDDAALSDGYPREHHHARPQPDVRTDNHVLFDTRLAPDRRTGRVVVVGSGDVHIGTE